MNIKGIELLRKMGLPGPKKEMIGTAFSAQDLNNLYDGANNGVTLVAFDYTDKINQNPLHGKNARRYNIPREDFFEVLEELTSKIVSKSVRRGDVVFLTHQSYNPEDISYSGRAATETDNEGHGFLIVEAVKSLRKGSSDFNPEFICKYPIIGGRLIKGERELVRNNVVLPEEITNRIVRDVKRISGKPNVDFEVYKENGNLFYHDMFLAEK